MSDTATIVVTSGDKLFYIDWTNASLNPGDWTKKVVISINNTNIQTVNPDNNTLTFDYQDSNRSQLTGSTTFGNLIYGEEYIVTLIQYYVKSAGGVGTYSSNTVRISVGSSPDPCTLISPDSATINDLTSISIKIYFPENYSNGGQPITQVSFLVSYYDTVDNYGKLFDYIFDKSNDDIYLLDNLYANKTYEIWANIWNDVGMSVASNVISEVTSGYPLAPSSFVISTVYSITEDETKVSLNWEPPNNADLTDLIGYYIRYNLTGESSFNERVVVGRTDGTLINQLSYDFVNEFTTYGETFEFKIVSYNSLGINLETSSSATKFAYIFKNALPVQNVTSIPGDELLYLSWTAPSYLRGYALNTYIIKLYTSAVFTQQFTTYEPTYTIEGLTNGQQDYSVVIFAQTLNTHTNTTIDGASVSIESTDLNNMTTTPFTNPSAPSFSSSSVVPSDSTITLTWTEPSSNGGFPIDHYVVSYKLNSESSYTDINVGNVNTKVLDGLTNGTSYDVKIYAVNTTTELTQTTNEGLPYSVFNIQPYKASNSITELNIIAGDALLDCSWTPPSDTGGFDIDHYKVYLNDETSFVTTESTAKTITGLTNGQSYTVTIVPYTLIPYLSDELMGAASLVSFAYYPFKLSDAVGYLTATPSDSSILLSWDAPSAESSELPIDHYNISYNTTTITTTGTTATIAAVNGENITYTVTPVVIDKNPGDNYGSEIIGVSAAVESRAYTKPADITGLDVIPSDSKLKLLFYPSNYSGGYDISQYKISYKKTIIGTYTDILINIEDLEYDENSKIMYTFNADNGSGYYIKVSVINSVPGGLNNASDDVISENKIPYKASLGITNFNVVSGDEQLLASWGAPSDTGGFAIYNYMIYLDDQLHDTTSSKYISFTSLVNGQYYTISVVPVTRPDYLEGAILLGASVSYETIKPYANPDAPNPLSVIENDKEIVFSWVAPIDNGGNTIVGYRVIVANTLNTIEYFNEDILDTTSTTVTFNINNISTITNGDRYNIKCSTITQYNNTFLYSTDQSTEATPCGKPTEISYTINASTNEITAIVNNNGTTIIGFLVCAPSTVSTDNIIANIVVQKDSSDIISSSKLYDTFIIPMNYTLATSDIQPIIIVVTNAKGMYYIENFN